MKYTFGLLAVLILASCLVSTVSAGCESCNIKFLPGGYRSGPPDYSKDSYWGMSAEDIRGSVDYSLSNPDSTATKYDTMPVLVVPTSNSNKFANLPTISGKNKDSGSNFFGVTSPGKNYSYSGYGSLITSGKKPIL